MQCTPFKDPWVHSAWLPHFVNDCFYKMLSNIGMNPLQPHWNAQPGSGGVGCSVRPFASAPKPKSITQCKKVTFHDFIPLYSLKVTTLIGISQQSPQVCGKDIVHSISLIGIEVKKHGVSGTQSQAFSFKLNILSVLAS